MKQWRRSRAPNGDTVWTRGEFLIRVVGEDASGKPTYWGLWKNGSQVFGKWSIKLGRNTQLQWDTLRDAKAYVDRYEAAERWLY